MLKTDDIRIASLKPIPSPAVLVHNLPLSEAQAQLVQKARNEASQIIQGADDRLLAIVGPCSIHDKKAALEYGERLQKQIERFKDDLCIIMRVYFEKPRTTVGWKGLINDPRLDNSFDITAGLTLARELLSELTPLDVPTGTEFLDSIIPQYISDLISWGAIGARTTESQVHRELASGLSMPIGFKNGTDGNIAIGIAAAQAARHSHHFLSISKLGVPIIAQTTGNEATHIILRGASSGPNYYPKTIQSVTKKLAEKNLPASLMVDCSHGNSGKDHERQIVVAQDIAHQVTQGSHAIHGVMLESNLLAGKQVFKSQETLTYGQSITDACMGWEDTEKVLEQLAQAVQARRQHRD